MGAVTEENYSLQKYLLLPKRPDYENGGELLYSHGKFSEKAI